MPSIKIERIKVEAGDCVSKPTNYWGESYAKKLKDKYNINRIFGRVRGVIDNSDLSVVWDSDKKVDKHMSLVKCNP